MEESPPFSWWLDGRSRPSHLSPCLLDILSDLDEKIKMIVSLIQDDGESFTERAETFYKRRPELLKILNELHKSYRSLAQKYDNLRSPETTSLRVAHLRSSFSSLKTDFSDSDPQPQTSRFEKDGEEGLDKLIQGVEWKGKSSCEVWKLIEDNLSQQSELIRRNDEKREVIKQLRAQISKLMEENRALKSYISSYKLEFKESDSRSFGFKGLNCLGNFRG